MAHLTINGLTVSVADGSSEETLREIGETEAAFDGTLRKTRQAVKRDLGFTTTPLSGADGYAWDSLLRGIGEHWAFDTSLYGSKGLGPSSLGAGVIVATTGTPKFGAGQLLVPNTQTIVYPAVLGSSWTVMAWRFESAAWHHYIVRSDGTKWKDGATSVAATTWLSVSGGTITITGVGGSDNFFDDLVAFPFLIPTDWPAVFGVAASAFSDLPKLFAAGNAVSEVTTRTVLGSVATHRISQGALSGTWANNLRSLSVSLQEV